MIRRAVVVLCVVAATGQTYSHGAFSQCWQSMGWCTTRGTSPSPIS